MFLKAVETVSVIITIIAIGYFMAYKTWFREEDRKFLSKLIINISIPAITINNFFTYFNKSKLINLGEVILSPVISMFITYILGLLILKIVNIDRNRKGVLLSMLVVSNTIFMGLPVNIGLFGEISTPYVMIYYVINTIIFWGLCVPKIQEDGQMTSEDNLLSKAVKILNIPLIVVFLTIGLIILDYNPPSIVFNITQYLSGLSTPLSLIFIGGVIYDVGFNFNIDRYIVLIIFFRFILSPIISYGVSSFLGMDTLEMNVFLVQSFMPVMTQTVIVAENYGADYEYAAISAVLTTLLSLIVIPIYAYFLT